MLSLTLFSCLRLMHCNQFKCPGNMSWLSSWLKSEPDNCQGLGAANLWTWTFVTPCPAPWGSAKQRKRKTQREGRMRQLKLQLIYTQTGGLELCEKAVCRTCWLGPSQRQSSSWKIYARPFQVNKRIYLANGICYEIYLIHLHTRLQCRTRQGLLFNVWLDSGRARVREKATMNKSSNERSPWLSYMETYVWEHSYGVCG